MGKNKQLYWITIILLLLIVAITFFAGRKYFKPETFDNSANLSSAPASASTTSGSGNQNGKGNIQIPPDDDIHISVPNYSLQEIEAFLTNDECDKLIQIASTRLEPSRVYTDSADLNDTQNRKSDQAWLKNDIDPLVFKISQEVAKLSGFPIENQEDLQVVHYEPGGFFNTHYDACEGSKTFCQRMDGASGPRLWTYIIYLNDDLEGGETIFPFINKKVVPKKGKLVIFQSTDVSGKLIRQSLHGGEPVRSGVKWICNKWVRTNTFVG